MIGALRRWARGHTRERRYSPVGLGFHWSVAALVIFQLLWGWRTSGLDAGYEKAAAYQVHTAVGLLLLVLTLLRLAWRAMVPGPINDADKPGWQSTAAHITHYLFYGALIGLPLTGWAMVSATAPEEPLRLADAAPWPLLPFASLEPVIRWRIEAWAEAAHGGLIIAILVLIPLHIGAAVKHHVLDRHDVLAGMLPGVRSLEAKVLQAWRHSDPERSPPPASAAD